MKDASQIQIDIGISPAHRKEIAEGLSKFLADSYTLYLMTHQFHWNVTGPQFQTLHTMFETQYTDLAEAVDIVAERIRALGFLAPGSYTEFSKLSSLKTPPQLEVHAEEMIEYLIAGQEGVVRTAREVFAVAVKGDDAVTQDMLTERMRIHEKTAWMLRSLITRD